MLQKKENYTGREAALRIKNHLLKEFAVDLDKVISEAEMSPRRIRRAVVPLLKTAVAKRHNITVSELEEAYVTAFGISADDDSGVESNLNIIVNEEMYNALKAARDGEIENQVSAFANLMKQASIVSGETLAITLTVGGVLAIGGAMVRYIITEIAKDATLTILKAATQFLTSGSAAVGVVLFVLQLLVELFLYLASIVREFTGLVLNATTQTFVVNNWKEGAKQGKNDGIYMDAGEINSFMNNPTEKNQLMPAFTTSDDSGISKWFPMGLFSGAKKFGFYGVGGYIRFNSEQLLPEQSYVAMFANPYSELSGVNVALVENEISDQSAFYEGLYDGRSLFANQELQGSWSARIQGACNSQHGDQSYGIFVLE